MPGRSKETRCIYRGIKLTSQLHRCHKQELQGLTMTFIYLLIFNVIYFFFFPPVCCQEQQPGGLKRLRRVSPPHPGRRVLWPHPGAASRGCIPGPHPGAARSGGSLGERQPGGALHTLEKQKPPGPAARSEPAGAGGHRSRDKAVGHFQRLQRDPCAFV